MSFFKIDNLPGIAEALKPKNQAITPFRRINDLASRNVPMLEAMHEFCQDAPKTAADPLGRPMPSIWNELMRSSDEEES